MTSILLGLLGAALGAAFFIAGFLFGRKTAAIHTAPAEMTYIPTEEEKAEIEKQRERLRAEQDAFHKQMSYSADVAYGRTVMPGSDMMHGKG